jgi:hypothetical protein
MARPRIYDEETVVVSVRLPVSLRDRMMQMAKQAKRSLNQQMLLLIETGLTELDAAGGTDEPRAAKRGRSRSS